MTQDVSEPAWLYDFFLVDDTALSVYKFLIQ